MSKKKAVVLLSGGLDSATTLFVARTKGYDCHCLSFDYGQRHRREIIAAKKIAKKAGCGWQLVKLHMPWKGSSLTDKRIKVALNRKISDISKDIPNTYVPGRNIIFLSNALSLAEVIGARAIFIGANAVDFSGYPDCRPKFYDAFRDVLRHGTKSGVSGRQIKIFTPLISKSKKDIIKLGKRLGVPYELTWSCYMGDKVPCGRCDSCILRCKGFNEAGVDDPLEAKG